MFGHVGEILDKIWILVVEKNGVLTLNFHVVSHEGHQLNGRVSISEDVFDRLCFPPSDPS